MYDHVVLISVDTLRSDGIAGSPLQLWPHEYRSTFELRTPRLDELARGGAFFANTISAAPYTSASHASLLTGLWPPNHGAREFFGPPVSASTVFTAARRRGYRTILKTDFPVMLGGHLGFRRDVDEYIVEDDDAFVAAVEGARRSLSLLHFGSVHIPYGFHSLRFGGRDYVEKVDALEAEVGATNRSVPADVLSETYRTKEDLELLFRYKQVVVTLYADRRYDRLFELYLEGIARFSERRLAPVIDRLRSATSRGRALFVLFGDHGEAYNEETYGHFNSVDEGVLRVPLLFWGDDVVPGAFTSRVRTVDLAPTLYEMLDWPAPGPCDGVSLWPAIRGGRLDQPRRAYSQAFVAQADEAFDAQRQCLAGDETRAVRHVLYKEAVYDGDHKLSRRHYVPGSENHVPVPCAPVVHLEQLDAGQRLRTAADDAVTRHLSGLLDGYGGSPRDAGPSPPIPPELRRHLENHGYLQGRERHPRR